MIHTLLAFIFFNYNFQKLFHALGLLKGPEKFQTPPMLWSFIFKGTQPKFQPHWIIRFE